MFTRDGASERTRTPSRADRRRVARVHTGRGHRTDTDSKSVSGYGQCESRSEVRSGIVIVITMDPEVKMTKVREGQTLGPSFLPTKLTP